MFLWVHLDEQILEGGKVSLWVLEVRLEASQSVEEVGQGPGPPLLEAVLQCLVRLLSLCSHISSNFPPVVSLDLRRFHSTW